MRESNIEAVRILAMSMVVIWHYMVHGGIIDAWPHTQLLSPLIFGGVPLFILVSGWFSINIKWKTIISLVITLWIFYIFIELALIPLGAPINKGRIFLEIFSPLSRPRLWFVGIYTALVVLSPILNNGLKSLSIRQLRTFIILFSVFEFYSCWIFNNRTDDSGYSIITFTYLYVLGYFLRHEPYIKTISIKKIVSIGILSLIVNFALTYAMMRMRWLNLSSNITHYINLDAKYSNPLLIIQCCSILIIFSRLKFSSKFINSVASAAFGVYLLQDCALGDEFLYPFEQYLIFKGNMLHLSLYLTIQFIALWLCSWFIMRVVKICSMPIDAYVTKRLQNLGFSEKNEMI